MPDHAAFMRRALLLAQKGWGAVHPNPLVGAVIVNRGEIVGEGWHAVYGGPHAEVEALRAAGAAARGATMYVTLEPCAHHGKTPPCTEAIIAAGVARVFYAVRDPDPVASGGAARLGQAGVDVVEGVEAAAARRLDAGFFMRHERDATFVTLKLAMTLDGRIAVRPGERTAITGSESHSETHRLRAGYDAIMVGIETALTDDPLLTVRAASARVAPVRVVLDSRARLPLSSRLLASLDVAPVIVLCGEDAPPGRIAALRDAGAAVQCVGRAPGGLDLGAALQVLRDRGVRTLFVEGGGRVAASLLAAGLIQRMHLFVAPTFLGSDGVAAFSLQRPTPGAWECTAMDRHGADVLLTYDRAERVAL
jgi:diaminohydroxyphosphoribosylaminopyrimidine deaminase / 5-amino-6-(5-phosphoribosylamino)uracil reductase